MIVNSIYRAANLGKGRALRGEIKLKKKKKKIRVGSAKNKFESGWGQPSTNSNQGGISRLQVEIRVGSAKYKFYLGGG